MIRVQNVTPAADHHLILRFTNGERRLFDMRPFLQVPVYRQLQNAAVFALAHVDYGTVVWPGEVDIAPETLYDRSAPLVDDAATAS
jgi:hypothetical protein